MSGGFFRGTSADQDTRFSNKMSKLLKSQKFAPELDVLVEMSKVKIDVIKPWIATRVTELLGFEDEVLINFIYGLLDVKEADGKHLQIQLTGFMEKNTGRFMKELWALLTSAQNNLSGVPQQFLDAKAEEAKKKKEEKDRIVSEVRRKKEEQEKNAEEERLRRLSSRDGSSKAKIEKRGTSGSPGKGFNRRSFDGYGGSGGRNGRGARRTSVSSHRSRSPSSSPSRGSPPTRYRRRRSRSWSPRRRRRSVSPFRRRSPVQRYSPLPPRSPRRRWRSPYDSRSPPRRRKSPLARTPPRFRSRSPPRNWRRSPVGLRSPPPYRRAGPPSPPLRRRSLSESESPPVVRRSPSRSPYVRRRSPSRDRVVHRTRSSSRRRQSSSRDRGLRQNGSPFQRRRSPSREFGVSQIKSPHRTRRSTSRERGRYNGFDARERNGPNRERDWSERPDKGDIADRRISLSIERDHVSSREGRNIRPSAPQITGEKRLHREREEHLDLEPAKESSEAKDVELTWSSRKHKAQALTESPVKVASESDDEVDLAPRQDRVAQLTKEVNDDGGVDEDGSQSPDSTDERRAAKRRRKEDKRLRKEERRKRREEKHRRREEKRVARAAKGEVGKIGDDNTEAGNNNQNGGSEGFGSLEADRSDGEEREDEQRRIERELRNKALESLRAKKGVAC